jgi:hypothetical protein
VRQFLYDIEQFLPYFESSSTFIPTTRQHSIVRPNNDYFPLCRGNPLNSVGTNVSNAGFSMKQRDLGEIFYDP